MTSPLFSQGVSRWKHDNHKAYTYLLAMSKPGKREKVERRLVECFIHQEQQVIRQPSLVYDGVWLPKLSLSPSPMVLPPSLLSASLVLNFLG